MKRKYVDCQRLDGDCTKCSLVSYGRDCYNRPITKLEWYRLLSGTTQAKLAAMTGISTRTIQRIENGEAGVATMTVKNLLAIADALEVDIKELLDKEESQ